MIPKTIATASPSPTGHEQPGPKLSEMLGLLHPAQPSDRRVQGHLLSRRPTMTPEKRERIAAKIRAQQEAARPAAEEAAPPDAAALAVDQPSTSAAPRTGYPLGEFIGTMADSIWTCTQWASDKIFGSSPAEVSGGGDTAQCEVQGSARAQPAGKQHLTLSNEDFRTACVKNGFSEADARKIQESLTRRGIPLSDKTVPAVGNHHVVDGKLTKKPGASTSIEAEHYRGVFSINGQQKYHWVKCYPPPLDAGYVQDHYAYQNDLGIDRLRPFYEGRAMLASNLCQLLGWSVVPPVHLGFINGAPCTVTEYVKGESLATLVQRESTLADHIESLALGTIEGADYPVLGPEAKLELAKLAVIGALLGNKDMHMNQIHFPDSSAKSTEPPKSAQVYDWDTSCGKRTRTVEDVYAAVPGTYFAGTSKPLPRSKAGFWPSDKLVQQLRDEFLQKITPETLREQAAGLINEQEIEALVDRYHSLRKRLEAA